MRSWAWRFTEEETFWVEFLRRLKRRGPQVVKLVISNAHEGIKGSGGTRVPRHLATLAGGAVEKGRWL